MPHAPSRQSNQSYASFRIFWIGSPKWMAPAHLCADHFIRVATLLVMLAPDIQIDGVEGARGGDEKAVLFRSAEADVADGFGIRILPITRPS